MCYYNNNKSLCSTSDYVLLITTNKDESIIYIGLAIIIAYGRIGYTTSRIYIISNNNKGIDYDNYK